MALRQKIAAQTVGNLAGIDAFVLFRRRFRKPPKIFNRKPNQARLLPHWFGHIQAIPQHASNILRFERREWLMLLGGFMGILAASRP